MLHAHPQLVHLSEVNKQEVHRICDVTPSTLILGPHIWQQAPRNLHRDNDNSGHTSL